MLAGRGRMMTRGTQAPVAPATGSFCRGKGGHITSLRGPAHWHNRTKAGSIRLACRHTTACRSQHIPADPHRGVMRLPAGVVTPPSGCSARCSTMRCSGGGQGQGRTPLLCCW